MTRGFFRYSPSKEDVLFGELEAMGVQAEVMRLVERTPALRARLLQKRDGARVRIVEALIGRGVAALEADLAAAAAGAALDTVARRVAALRRGRRRERRPAGADGPRLRPAPPRVPALTRPGSSLRTLPPQKANTTFVRVNYPQKKEKSDRGEIRTVLRRNGCDASGGV
ncbi:hypothetical protein ABZW49_29990 [Nonomuraea wenchangensis]